MMPAFPRLRRHLRARFLTEFGLALSLVSFFGLSACAQAASEQPKRWVAYYAADADPEQLKGFDVVVVDSIHHPPLRPLMNRGKTILAYVSFGEIAKDRPELPRLQAQGVLLGQNKNWGSAMIDIRRQEWVAMMVEEIIPELIRQGFDGIMIDTLDSAIHLEETDPQRYAGMQEAAVQMVRQVRMNYPNLKIMVNRAFPILPPLAREVDYVLAESIYSTYRFDTKKHELIKTSYYQSIADSLNALKKTNPALEIMTLDYWPVEDKPGMRAIYDAQRASGFTPYVATVDLHHLVSEPE